MSSFIEYSHFITFIGAVVVACGALLSAQRQALKNQEIAELNRTIANSVTGGDSHARLGLMLDPGNFGLIWIVVAQKGSFPVYDIQLQLRNLTRQWDMSQAGVKEGRVYYSWDQIQKETEWNIDVGNLGPGQHRVLARIRLPDDRGEQDFVATVTSRNDTRDYEFWFRLVNGVWVRGLRIKRAVEVLESDIPVDIQTDEKGDPRTTANRLIPWPVPLP